MNRSSFDGCNCHINPPCAMCENTFICEFCGDTFDNSEDSGDCVCNECADGTLE